MNLDSTHPERQKNPEGLLRLFLKTAIVSVIVIVTLKVFSFYQVFSGFVISTAEDNSVQLCHLLLDQQKTFLFRNIPGQGMQLAIDSKELPALDRNMRSFLHPFNITKIKIYDNNRRIIYSTEKALIGLVDANNKRLSKALAGKADTELETKGQTHDLSEEKLLDVDVVETYIPIKDNTGKVLGSFETYVNVTKYRAQIRTGLLILTTVLVLILVAVFGFSYILIRKGVNQLKQVQSELEMLAVTDVLTGIANRRRVMARGEEEFARAIRSGERNSQPAQLCCVMLDIDHFKRVNDTFGHQAGDQVLREVAQRLQRSVRPYDIIGRYGGEEFVVLLPDTSFEQTRVAAERIRMAVCSEPISINGDGITVSISLGISCLIVEDHCLDDLLKRADEGLYKAKNAGRDRVEWV